jgi:hypothetical protein
VARRSAGRNMIRITAANGTAVIRVSTPIGPP